ncbi:MAG: DUF3533 domain-containing protein [Actinobacteria bacterium]|nr:DUF3533 domain-containing protein [Actinomycetota bacterium]
MSEGAPPPIDRRTLVRAAAAIAGVTLLSLLFIASYAGALHEPRPHDVPLAVDEAVPAPVVAKLAASPALAVESAAGVEGALAMIDRREAYGALVAAPGGALVLYVAPAASAAVADFLAAEVPKQLRAAGVPVRVRTVHPLPASDTRGLVGFYTVIGWAIAGYLGATLLGLAFGTSPSRARTAWRFVALAALGLLVGLGGAAISTAIAGYDNGFAELVLIGLMTVLATGAVTVALQSLLGILGTGVAILLFVVFGNPAAGGPYASELLPGIWRFGGQLIPTGAATTAVRNVTYFPQASIGLSLLCLALWIAAGAVVAIVFAGRGRGLDQAEAEASAAGLA